MDKELEDEVFDPSVINKLLFSIGKLRFSLRGLETTDLQAIASCKEELESDTNQECSCTESNKILENIITELESNSMNKNKQSNQCNALSVKDSSINKLEGIHERLQEKLKKMKLSQEAVLKEKLDKYKTLASHC